ncbi:8840_t:CDS:2, partial [Scutellospora calospora]
VPKKECIFFTFDEACAFVENYASQTNIVTILGKTTKNSDDSGYRQAFFVCEKQGSYNGKKKHILLSEQQQKLQELYEIKILLKTLQNDKNITASIAIKPEYNDERNQDDLFIQ